METSGRRGARALVVVLTLTAAACGAADGGTADDEGPLGGYLDEIWGEYDPNAPDPLRAIAEERIAACMGEAGFEYQPVTEMSGAVFVYDETLRGTLEFAQQFGYGYTTESQGPGKGTMNWPVMPERSAAELLNEAYVGSLSTEAQQQYYAALLGELAEPLDDPESVDWDALDRGCQGRGYDEAYEDWRTPEEFTEVQDAINAVWARVEEDPRVTEALTAWASCMHEAGYPDLSQLIDAENLVTDLWNTWNGRYGSQIDLSLGETEFEAVRASLPDELAELQAEEIAIAVADMTCREESGYTEIRRDVALELEQQVVDTYRDDLEAWVEHARAQRAERG